MRNFDAQTNKNHLRNQSKKKEIEKRQINEIRMM
jgi:hypothetical protein